MLIDRATLDKHGVKPCGVFHAGAHLGEETPLYLDWGVKSVLWVEADLDVHRRLQRTVKIGSTLCAVIGATDGADVVFHKANNGQSSSILDLGTHEVEHPEVHYVGEEKRSTKTIDTICQQMGFHDWDFLNLDLQGAELLALMGATEELQHVQFVYTEVNKKELYKGCALVGQIDEFLIDFSRVETVWTPHGWGDALYVRNDEIQGDNGGV